MKFIETTKQVFRENKLCKFLTIGGGVAALTNTFAHLPLLGLFEYGGLAGGTYLINKVVKKSEFLDNTKYGYIAKSAFLVIGASAVHVATKFLPFGHFTDHVTNTFLYAGIVGVVDGSLELYNDRNRTKILDATGLENEKMKNTSSLFSKNTKEVESENYVGLRNRGLHATEPEEAALTLTKTFKKS